MDFTGGKIKVLDGTLTSGGCRENPFLHFTRF